MAQLQQTMDVDLPTIRLTVKVRHLRAWQARLWAVSRILKLATLVGGSAFAWDITIEGNE